MAFDEIVAGRIRTLLVDEPNITEMRMFGGLAFLVKGNMAVVAGSKGGVMVRTDAGDADASYLADAAPMVMNGREMANWLTLDAAAIEDDDALGAVVAHGLAFARTLPAK